MHILTYNYKIDVSLPLPTPPSDSEVARRPLRQEAVGTAPLLAGGLYGACG